MKPGKAKMLGGAPRSGKWTKQPEDTRVGGKHRGSLILLIVLGVGVLGGVGGYLAWANAQVQGGILRQQQEARRRPDWVPLAQLPLHVRHAFAAVVDTTSFSRRSMNRDAHLPPASNTLVRQVHRLPAGLQGQAQEMTMAPLLEAHTSPRSLLELYLNRVEMGRTENWGVYGIGHAARDFFGKDVRRLTLSEAATLAGILLPPRLADPEADPGAAGTRRNEVLRALLGSGKINEAAFRAAVAEPLAFQPGVDYAPMTRPVDWEARPEVIRLPEALRPRPDSAASPAGRPGGA